MNKIILIGNLTRDPDLRMTQTGVNVTTFTVAVSRKGKAEGTDYFRVTCWRGLADIAAKYLSKGRKVAIVGQVTLGSYKDRNGELHYNMEVVADDLELLTPRSEAGEAAPENLEPQLVETPQDLPF